MDTGRMAHAPEYHDHLKVPAPAADTGSAGSVSSAVSLAVAVWHRYLHFRTRNLGARWVISVLRHVLLPKMTDRSVPTITRAVKAGEWTVSESPTNSTPARPRANVKGTAAGTRCHFLVRTSCQ